MADEPTYELYMFMRSHFNEKVRWALDFKGIPHRRRPILPGPHASTVKRMTGQTAVPVLLIDGAPIHGSARIIDELERRHPEPPLYPVDESERERAFEIQRYFDEEVGPKIRRALFSILIEHPGYLSALFASHRSAPLRLLYGGIFPLVKRKMQREMQVFEPHVGEAYDTTAQAFEYVAKHVGPSGYLAGDRFSVADLTAAAMLAPGVDVRHPDMLKPEPRPKAIDEWLARWADLPGARWVQEIYETHRLDRAPGV
jgi:glutathione S-transferase